MGIPITLEVNYMTSFVKNKKCFIGAKKINKQIRKTTNSLKTNGIKNNIDVTNHETKAQKKPAI